jgi:hypothetical protein
LTTRFTDSLRAFARPFLWALVLSSAGPSRVVAAPEDLTLLQVGAGAVRFAVEVPPLQLVPLAGASRAQEPRLSGYDLDGVPGGPALPLRVVTVAVPPTGTVEVSAQGAVAEWRDGVRLAHLPRVTTGRGSEPAPVTLELQDPPEIPAANPSVAVPLARVLEVTWMRDQRVARIAVSPAAYDEANGRLSLFRKVEVEVRFGAAVAAPPQRGLGARTDGFEPLYRDVLVNYDQGRAWRRGTGPGLGTLRAGAATSVPATSVFAGRTWVKISIPRTGFYRVNFGQVRNSALFGGDDSVRVDSLRLFTWPGVPVLPEDSYCDSCDFRQVAIGVADAAADGLFHDNENDYFYFYALGASDWTDLYVGPQDAPQADTVFMNHPYEAKNYYYLTIATDSDPIPGGPKRIASVAGALVDTIGALTPATFTARAHFEQDREFHPDATPITGLNFDGSYRRTPEFWEKWFWASINNTSSASLFQETVDLPGIEPSLPARLRLRAWGLSQLTSFQKSEGVFDHYLDVGFGDVSMPRRGWDLLAAQSFDTTVGGLAATGNRLTASVPPSAAVEDSAVLAAIRRDVTAIAWFDVFYPRRFRPVNEELLFDSDRTGGKYVYDIGPFTGGAPDSIPRVFDVTDPYAPLEVMGAEYLFRGGGWRMRFNRLESSRRRYRILPDYGVGSRIVKPPNQDVVDAAGANLDAVFLAQPGQDNLRSGHGADYLLIFYDSFQAAAESLVAWRRERLPLVGKNPPFDALKVPVSAIYDQFSGGRTDPGAIRNFLRAVDAHWTPKPTYVTFLGDASSDFKNITGSAPAGQPGALVPSYEGGFDLAVERQYATDDWMLNVNDPFRVVPDFQGGRIPAASAVTALAYVRDKLLLYERRAPLGEWRDRVMLIGDDNEQGSKPDQIYWGHMEQTVALDTEGMPPEVDRAYVYLHTYPDGPNETKPGAKADILRTINEGALMSNYIGHGSPFKFADESVLLDSDVDGLVNRDRLTVLVAASCDVGKFNSPSISTLGERILFASGGGAVGVISATEQAFSNQNASLNLRLYKTVFQRDSTTGRFERTLAQGLAAAKTGATNAQKYQLMGDAALRLALPRLTVETMVSDVDGNPVSDAQRGQTLVASGRVLDRPGGTLMALEGLAHLLIEDSAPVDTVPNCFGGCFGYPFRASPVFRGDVSVSGGRFETRFVVPMDAHLGPRGRARAYVEVGTGVALTDGVGQVAVPVAAGVAPTDDREGPRVALSFVGGATRVRPNAMLRVDLSDPSGILITGNAPQNGIIVTLDENSTQRYDITPSFRYAANSYQGGAAFFQLPGLVPGSHRVKVSAADNLAVGIAAGVHRNFATLDFEVTEQPSLRVTRAILFPNPVRSGGVAGGGQFVVDAPGDSVEVLLKIYTVAGKLVRVLESGGGLAQVQIPWDGLDAERSPLATGAYLFKVQVFPVGSTVARDQRAEATGRFVVVGR